MAKAIWNGKIIAESDKAILIEGNLYFPPDSVRKQYLRKTDKEYTCRWKGVASYCDLIVEHKLNKNAAWFYDKTTTAAKSIRNWVAFDRALGVIVEGTAVRTLEPPSPNRVSHPQHN